MRKKHSLAMARAKSRPFTSRDYAKMAKNHDFSYLSLEVFGSFREGSLAQEDENATVLNEGVVPDIAALLDRILEEPPMPFYFPAGALKALETFNASPAIQPSRNFFFLTSNFRQYVMGDASNATDGSQIRKTISKIFQVPPGEKTLIFRMHSWVYGQPLDDFNLHDLSHRGSNEKEFLKFYVSWPSHSTIANLPDLDSTWKFPSPIKVIKRRPSMRFRATSPHDVRVYSWPNTGRKRQFSALDSEASEFDPSWKKRRIQKTPPSYRGTPENHSSHHSSISPCYSLASSRTVSTDYGIYFRRRAFSLDSDESDVDERINWRGISIVKEESD